MSKKYWVLLAAVPLGVLALMGARGVSQTTSHATSTCPDRPVVVGQSGTYVFVDASKSTYDPTIRTAYAEAAARAVDRAVTDGAYLNVSVFGGSIAGIKTVCETSTRTASAAPLFATAAQSGLKQNLTTLLNTATSEQASDPGSDIYGALVDAVQQIATLRPSLGPARLLVETDGDQAAGNVHLRRLLTNESDERIAKLIIGGQPVPDAAGIDIEIRGIGRTSSASETTPTVATRRTTHIWELVCHAMQASHCTATSSLS